MNDASTSLDTSTRLLGELGIWFFVIGDMFVFSIFFFVYLYERTQQVEIFDAAQQTLNAGFGFANTLLLLTSSWFVVQALRVVREGMLPRARQLLTLAMVCGLGFGINKLVEWSGKLAAGQSPLANDFYMLFFVFTGIHFLHLIIGMFVLFFMWRRLNRGSIGEGDIVMLENGASFWHLVDLLWIVLFALLYLVHS